MRRFVVALLALPSTNTHHTYHIQRCRCRRGRRQKTMHAMFECPYVSQYLLVYVFGLNMCM